MQVLRDEKHIKILDGYGFHLGQDGEIVIGDVGTNGAWKIRTEGNFLKFDRSSNGAWQEAIGSFGASFVTDNFILNTPSGTFGHQTGEDSSTRKTMMRPSLDHSGVIVGNLEGRVGFVSNGELGSAHPSGESPVNFNKEPRSGVFAAAAQDVTYSAGSVFEQDGYSFGGTFWADTVATKYRISIIDVFGNVVLESQIEALSSLNQDTPSVVVGANTFKWNSGKLFPKGFQYNIRIQTPTDVGWELSTNAGLPAYDVFRQAVEITNIPTAKVWRAGSDYKHGDYIYQDIKSAGYDYSEAGHYTAVSDFTGSSISFATDVLAGRLKKAAFFPGSFLANDNAGYNFDWGKLGIHQDNPREALDVTGNVKAVRTKTLVAETEEVLLKKREYGSVAAEAGGGKIYNVDSTGDGVDGS